MNFEKKKRTKEQWGADEFWEKERNKRTKGPLERQMFCGQVFLSHIVFCYL